VVSPGNPSAQVTLQPASTAIPIVNNVRVSPGSGAKISVRRNTDGSVEARGWIGSGASPRYYQLVVDDPAIFTAGSLRAALPAPGVIVAGQTRLAPTPAGAVHVASLKSAPLSNLAAVMNRESINHFAELLFRDVAHHATPNGVGSAEAGNALLQRFMTDKVGLRENGIYAADGSGLSTLDRITARGMVHLL